jgi:hypothetical protein
MADGMVPAPPQTAPAGPLEDEDETPCILMQVSVFDGVRWSACRQRWRAQARHPDGGVVELGYYRDDCQAARVRSAYLRLLATQSNRRS